VWARLGGRIFLCGTTAANERVGNVQIRDGIGEDEFVAMRA
jgi:hypothetical protein